MIGQEEVIIPISLNLGMFFNPDRDCQTKKQKAYGMEYRDKTRSKKMEQQLSVKVVSLDKQNTKREFYHIRSNFNSSKDIKKDIIESFPDGSFRRVLYIFLDYFHSPVS